MLKSSVILAVIPPCGVQENIFPKTRGGNNTTSSTNPTNVLFLLYFIDFLNDLKIVKGSA